MTFTEWLNYTSKDKNPADEIAIFCLARMYNKHIMIYTTLYCWSKLLHHFSYTEKEIDQHCDIKLILFGKHKYAHVRSICPPPFGTIPKPFSTKVKDEDNITGIKTEAKSKQGQPRN